MDRKVTVLNVGAHPADALDRVGGTLALHVKRGDNVAVAVLSHGARSHAWKAFDERRKGETPDVDKIVDAKEQEVIDGCAELGVTDVRFLRYEDEVVLVNEPLIQDIADVIVDVRPDIIVTHHPYEGQPAHAACAQMTLLAIDVAGGVRKGREGVPGHKVAQVFFTSLSGRMTSLEPNRFPTMLVDITEVIQQKRRAMEHLASQYYQGPLTRKVLDVYEGYYGLHARVPWVEPFVAYKPDVYTHLQVSDFNLDLAKKSAQDALDHMMQMLEP